MLWMQFGVGNDEAPHSVGDAGRGVKMDRCCKIEHASFLGGQRTMGLNTGVMTSRLAMWKPHGGGGIHYLQLLGAHPYPAALT